MPLPETSPITTPSRVSSIANPAAGAATGGPAGALLGRQVFDLAASDEGRHRLASALSAFFENKQPFRDLRFPLRVHARVLDRHRDAAGERREEREVAVTERGTTAAVHDLDDADHAMTYPQRRAEEVARGDPRRPVDAAVEARVGRGIVDAQRRAVLEHGAGNATIGGKAQAQQALGDLGSLGDVGEVELVLVGVEQQDRRPAGIEDVATFGEDERAQLIELDACSERAAELVEEAQPRRVAAQRLRGRGDGDVLFHGHGAF